MVGARDRRGEHVVGEPIERVAGVGHVVSDDVDDLVIIFHPAAHLHQPAAHHHAALLFLEIGPDDQIDDSGLVLEGDEAHPLGAARALADQHHPGDLDHAAELAAPEVASAHEAAFGQARAQESQGMGLQAEPRGLVIGHHLLAQRHGGEPDRRTLGPFVARFRVGPAGMREQRQLVRRHQAARVPQRLTPRQAERTEGVGAGEPLDMRRADPGAVPQRDDVGKTAMRLALGDQPRRHRLGQPVDLPEAQADGDMLVEPAHVGA
jgi:hypothetical protein